MKLERPDGTNLADRKGGPPAVGVVEPHAITVDFCSGLGGMSLAARQLGLAVVAGVDIDESSLKTFGHNFQGAVSIKETIAGTKVLAACREAILKHPQTAKPLVALSGPPCQGFSAAGS